MDKTASPGVSRVFIAESPSISRVFTDTYGPQECWVPTTSPLLKCPPDYFLNLKMSHLRPGLFILRSRAWGTLGILGFSTGNPGSLWLIYMVVECRPVSHLGYLIPEGSALTNGGLNLHSPVKRKLETEKDYVFDKRLRYSVRQNESNCRFRDIVVRKEEGFTHILLSSQTSDNNALTPEVKSFGGDN